MNCQTQSNSYGPIPRYHQTVLCTRKFLFHGLEQSILAHRKNHFENCLINVDKIKSKVGHVITNVEVTILFLHN